MFKIRINPHARMATILLLVIGLTTLSAIADPAQPLAISAVELERAHLAEIVTEIDQLVTQVETASHSGASGRVQFNYDALRRDLLSRRELIQRYINGNWDVPRDITPMASTYNR